MDSRPPRKHTRILVAIGLVGAIAIAIFAEYFLTTSLIGCPTLTVGPGSFSLRVVSDSNQTPASGAQVTATSIPASYLPANCQGTQTTFKFTTNDTEWYSLPANWYGGFSLVVRYSGQSYSFTVSLPVESLTCSSLYVPSGMTNATRYTFQNDCPSMITTTSSGSPQLYRV
jgi:hypothetical protein